VTHTIAEYEATFDRDPSSAEAFAALRRHYQGEDTHERHVLLLERHAASVEDTRRAADLVWRASELHRKMSDADREMRSLNRAVALDPQHRQALERSCELARERDASSILLEQLTRLKTLVGARGERRRMAELDMELAKLWEERFFRWDKAIEHYELAHRAAPRDSAALAASRRLLTILGQWDAVADLYRSELENIRDNPSRAELLLELADLAREKLNNLELAARTLAEASSIRPGDEMIMERLGELYASSEWPNPGGLDRAATIFMQIAQRRESRGDRDGSISYLRRALGADPENQAASARLERAYRETGRWEDLDQLYRQRLGVAGETESVQLELKRAEMLERHLGDRDAARRCYEGLLQREPPGGTAEARLRELYHVDGNHDALLALHKRTLKANVDRPTRIRVLMEMAELYGDVLDDETAAAALLHEVLQLDPTHRRALAAYERYFRAKGDYRNLSELIRFAAHAARERGAPAPDVCRLLEQWAEIAEEQLGDLPGALEAWNQIGELQHDPSAARVQAQRIQDKMGHFQQVAHDLKVGVAEASTPLQHTRALLKMALVFTEQNIDSLRAIELLREVLQDEPTDETALKALLKLYEREADSSGQVWVIEQRLQGILTREERLELTLKLAKLREDQQLPKEARLVYEQLLDLSPGNALVYRQLQGILEQDDDWPGVCGLLERRAQVSESITDRVEARRKLAQVLEEKLDATERAIEQWEEVLQVVDDDSDALDALARLYAHAQRPADKLRNLRRQLELSASAPIAKRAQLLREIATLSEALNLPQETLDAYETLNRLLPADRVTLHALGKLHEHLGQHGDLVDILERELDLENDPEEELSLALRQVDLLEHQLHDPKRAIACLERLVEQIAPGDLDAFDRLKGLHLAEGNIQRACQLAELQYVMHLKKGQAARLPILAQEIAEMWQGPLADDHGAATALERLLELSPGDSDAMEALRTIYRRIGGFARLAELGEALLGASTQEGQHSQLLFEQAELWEKHLGDPARAFEWYQRALFETPVEIAQTIASLCREMLHDPVRAFTVLRDVLDADPEGEALLPILQTIADENELFQQLHGVYGELIRRSSGERRMDLLRQQAILAEHKLDAPALALRSTVAIFAHLRGQDAQAPIVKEIERLAEASKQWDEALYVHLERLDKAPDQQGRVEILRHMATLLEEKMGSKGRAFDALLHAFVVDPNDLKLRDALWRLAAEFEKHPPTKGAHLGFVPSIAPTPLAPPRRVPSPPPPLIIASANQRLDNPTMELEPSQLLEIVATHPRAVDATLDLDERDLVVETSQEHRYDPTLELDASQVVEIVASGAHRHDPTMELESSQVVQVIAGTKAFVGSKSAVATPPLAPTPPPQGPPAPPPIMVTLSWLSLQPPTEGTAWERIAQTSRLLSTNAGIPVRVEHLLVEADMWAEAAHDVKRAFAALTEAAILAPTETESRHRLEQLAAEHSAYVQLFAAYDELTEHCTDRATLIDLHLRCAELHTEREGKDAALKHLQAVLAIQPEHGAAFDQLNAIYRERSAFGDLATLLERYLSAIGAKLDTTTRQRRLMELADLHQHHLDNPHEAARFLGRLLEERKDDPAILGRLADLYQELSLWPQVVEMLQSLLASTSEPGDRGPTLVRLGGIFERELELPHRAIETYQQALEGGHSAQEALEALERLYRAHNKEDQLTSVLRRRAEMAEDAQDAARWRLRLSELLQRAGQLEEAATELERARGAAPDDELDDRITTLLLGSGKADLAAERLRTRVDEARAAQAGPEAVVSALVRLARLLRSQLQDLPVAEGIVREALELLPKHLPALQELAHLLQQQEQWAAFAENTGSIASLLEDPQLLHEHLLQSASLLRDHGHGDIALALFKRALQQDPDSIPTIDALLALTEEPERRVRMLEHKRGLVSEPEAQADVLVALANERYKMGEPADAVLGSYKQAIELAPDSLEARDALSALLVNEGRDREAQQLLEQSIERLKNTPRAGELGRLYYSLGSLFERTRGEEEGYAFLRAAHRLQPKDLLLRLAIGQNRFRARRWREAMRHLREAIDHPEAPRHPEPSGIALYHAGICALELRRPSDALPFFEASLHLTPQHAPTLRAIAKLLLSEDQPQRAVEHLEKLANITSTAKDRIPLWQELAALYRDPLHQPGRAADVFELLLVDLQAKPGESVKRQVELLSEMLPVLADEARHEPAAVAAGALAASVDEVPARRDYLLEAARHHEASKSWQRADTCYKQTLHLDPTCSEAALGLALSLESQGRATEVPELLTKHLEHLQRPTERTERRLRARLYATMGKIYRQMGELDAAIDAFERQLDLQEDETVRHLLIELYADNPRRTAAALANHRVLARNIKNIDSLRAMAAASTQNSPYRAYCIYSVLSVLEQESDESRAFLGSYTPPALEADAHYEGEITQADREALLSAPGVGALREVFTTLWEAAPQILHRKIEDFGLSADDRISPVDRSDVAMVYTTTARTLRLKATGLYQRHSTASTDDRAVQVQVAGMARPAIIIPASLRNGVSLGRLRFIIARALELAQPASIFAAGMDRAEFAKLLTAVVRAFHPRYIRKKGIETTTREEADHFRQIIPYKLARTLSEYFRTHPDLHFDSGAWRLAALMSANRVGLAISGDLHAAVEQLRAEEPDLAGVDVYPEGIARSALLEDLLTFAASKAYYVTRVKLGMAGGG